MPIDPKQAALTSINEAISALDYDALGPLETDELTDVALEALMTAREMLTDKPWPEGLALHEPTVHEAWVVARTAEQIADGRQ